MKRIVVLSFLVAAASSAVAGDGVVVIQDLLKDVSAADRAAFAGALTLGEGRVLSANFKALKGLPDDRLSAVKAALAPKAEPKRKGKKAPKAGKMATLSELLKGVPKPVADEFMDGLSFIDGRVTSAVTGGLKKAVPEKRYREILDALAAPGTKVPHLTPKGVCGNGWCDDSACVSRGSERRHCESSQDSTCYSTCK